MNEYKVKYYLGDMIHTYVIEARNEYDATWKVLQYISTGSEKLFHSLTIERHYQEWN